ncbi:MAG: T9SS type A sorting domain-containing protein [Bacteroidota bacterium]|nr:T9SS type A sorting domain-containing protein [Bacteroidota bacterium]
MKKIFILPLLFIFCCTALGSNVFSIHTNKTFSGDTGKFTIIMNNDVKINGLNIVLRYDPNIITPISIAPTGRAGMLSGSNAASFGGDKISFLVYDVGNSYLPSDSSTIFEVEYLVTDSIKDSTTTQLTFIEGIVADSSLSIVPFNYVDGTMQISPTVGVKEKPQDIPQAYQLFQNYPNPFNPSTTIHFELPKESHVTLKVYNTLGQEVLTVLDEGKVAGRYDLRIDGTSLASGVYFYRLVAGDPSTSSGQVFVSTKKFVLIR